MNIPSMTREEIRRRVEELGQWFHNIDLQGVKTAPHHFLGDYPAVKWREFEHSIPKNLQGRTVLDIGCNGGFYALEMKRRGADRVVAIDSDEGYLAQAAFAAEVSGLDIEFRNLSVYDVGSLGEKFDVVLFMGVLYHLRHPLLALDLLYEHAVRDLLVFQSMLRGSLEPAEVRADYHFWDKSVFEGPEFPRMYFIEHCYAGDPTNWWIPNRACVEAMLRSAGFAILENPEQEVYVCKRAGVGSQKSGARSQEPGARRLELEARRKEPGARSPEPGARIKQPGPSSQEQGAKAASAERGVRSTERGTK